ncbi:MAG TPA: CopG family transcriptional regulator [Burkholderiaceae bacterium]|nr:CopG family transcriptional regulator [Burkholderiaceae bacterium]HMZ01481.1 CopG family transcriptional regulator [Burkholderiaceae bacterium]HNG80352.1 CopG family transcriptional regulator [Burkholderiaceae bacterium]
MSATTTIRLNDDLKARVTAAAERLGTTAHNFILEAVAEKAEQEERRAEFEAVAQERLARVAQTGKTVAWADLRDWLERRSAGDTPPRPQPKRHAG